MAQAIVRQRQEPANGGRPAPDSDNRTNGTDLLRVVLSKADGGVLLRYNPIRATFPA